MTAPLLSTEHPELYWAVLTALFTSMLWVPHIIQRIYEMKPYAALRDPRHDEDTKAPWAQQAIRAHTNAIENLVIFATFAVAINALDAGTDLTARAAALFFAARVGHYGVYVMGLPWLRTPLYLLGFACQSVLGLTLLGLV